MPSHEWIADKLAYLPKWTLSRKAATAIAFLWTIFVLVPLFRCYFSEREQVRDLAEKEARSLLAREQAVRFWVIDHGGLYMLATAHTPPNPYLSHLAERDIQLPSGQLLTLVNPNDMFRQIQREYGEQRYGVMGRMTSLNPLHPGNAPDEWERAALLAFAHGESEVLSFTVINGQPYLRLLQALTIEKSCLKCHTQQGYKIGEIRGGIGINVPLAPYLASCNKEARASVGFYLMFWLLGLAGLVLGFSRAQKNSLMRKRASDALLASEKKYRMLFEQAGDYLLILELSESQGLIIYDANQAASAIHGYSRAELIGMPVARLDKCLDESHLRALMDQILAGQTVRFETIHQKSDGTLFPVEVSSSLLAIPEGPVLFLSIERDITYRKQAEKEIRSLKNYLANIINSMPSILVGMDQDGVVTQWNKAGETITGLPACFAVGKPIAEVLPDFSHWIMDLRQEIGQTHFAAREKLLVVKKGERRFYDLMLYRLESNGIVEGMVARIEDVTERERVQEILVHTEKMMSLGGLAAGMAHEINNPLGIISQAAQNIERRVSPEVAANQQAALEVGVNLDNLQAYCGKREIPAFLKDIREAAGRASKIIANMLCFSRRSDLVQAPADLVGLLEQAVVLAANDYDLKKTYDFRSIEIVREYEADLPPVLAAAVEIEQVFLNLLKNAAQAMAVNPPVKKRRIILRLRRDEHYAMVEIEDNGQGMDEKVRRRIFEPFFTTKEPGVGTGLGLSVSYTIITQNHKGMISVESTPGTGTCFMVWLPLPSTESTPCATPK